MRVSLDLFSQDQYHSWGGINGRWGVSSFLHWSAWANSTQAPLISALSGAALHDMLLLPHPCHDDQCECHPCSAALGFPPWMGTGPLRPLCDQPLRLKPCETTLQGYILMEHCSSAQAPVEPQNLSPLSPILTFCNGFKVEPNPSERGFWNVAQVVLCSYLKEA